MHNYISRKAVAVAEASHKTTPLHPLRPHTAQWKTPAAQKWKPEAAARNR